MKSKPTKKPWRHGNEDCIVGWTEDGKHAECIGRLFVPVRNGRDYPALIANANLICAAPELLEACKDGLKFLDSLECPTQMQRENKMAFRKILLMAIKQAENPDAN